AGRIISLRDEAKRSAGARGRRADDGGGDAPRGLRACAQCVADRSDGRAPARTTRFGGGRGIRTPGTLPGTVVFKTTAIDHSAIPPAVAHVPKNVSELRRGKPTASLF